MATRANGRRNGCNKAPAAKKTAPIKGMGDVCKPEHTDEMTAAQFRADSKPPSANSEIEAKCPTAMTTFSRGSLRR
jgi:hypothetical protein